MAKFTIDGSVYDSIVSDFARTRIGLGPSDFAITVNGTPRTFSTGMKNIFTFVIDDMSESQWTSLKSTWENSRASNLSITIDATSYTVMFDPPNQEPIPATQVNNIRKEYLYSVTFKLREV